MGYQSATNPSGDWPLEERQQGWLYTQSDSWSSYGVYDVNGFLAEGTSRIEDWRYRVSRYTMSSAEKKKFMAGLYQLAEAHNHLCGKWMVFAPVQVVDELWQDICDANLQGRLGGCCKVCAYNYISGQHLICVYVKDFTDIVDCQRVLYALQDVCSRHGVNVVANFKCDFLTGLGIYHTKTGYVSCTYSLKELQLTREWPERRLKRILDNLKRRLRN